MAVIRIPRRRRGGRYRLRRAARIQTPQSFFFGYNPSCMLPPRSRFIGTQTSTAGPKSTAGFHSSMVKAAGPLAAHGAAFCVT